MPPRSAGRSWLARACVPLSYRWYIVYFTVAIVLNMLVFAGVLYWTLQSWGVYHEQIYAGWAETKCPVQAATASTPFTVDLFPDLTGWRSEITVQNTYLLPRDRTPDVDLDNVTIAMRSATRKYTYDRNAAEAFAARFQPGKEYLCWYNETSHASVKMTSDKYEQVALSSSSVTVQAAVSTTFCVLVGVSMFACMLFTRFWVLQHAELAVYDTARPRGDREARRKELPGKLPALSAAEMGELDNLQELQCFICLGGFNSDALSVDGQDDAETRVCVVRLPDCDHMFHHKCIDEWARLGHDECPVCRRSMWHV
ncbi:RING-H2 finger protein ATL73 [Porphyridium purpureum]|uniref:RING-H2 finger protein ATL73 n=1 Tax=Porphyridium purpureum TaxID=35688 RepID=A0A5J4Z0U3_PORPP|nr:RING-H2 finger protein ATL73 [Porphyridium purpureum]|eukprot:POR7806..scf208_2